MCPCHTHPARAFAASSGFAEAPLEKAWPSMASASLGKGAQLLVIPTHPAERLFVSAGRWPTALHQYLLASAPASRVAVSYSCSCLLALHQQLLAHALLQAWNFDDERLSCLFGLVKEVHTASVGQQLTIERSFAFFKDTLINHSIQR